MKLPYSALGKLSEIIPLSNPLRKYVMESDLSSDESSQTKPVKANPNIRYQTSKLSQIQGLGNGSGKLPYHF